MRRDGQRPRSHDGRRLDTAMIEALRAVASPPAATEVDWWTLRRTIVGDAAAFLDGPRRGWLEFIAGWIRPAVPIGLAVSIMAMIVVGSVGTVSTATLSSVVAADTTDGSLWLHAVRGGTPASDVDPLLEAPHSGAALVDAALASTR
jgi:hypothetical protein